MTHSYITIPATQIPTNMIFDVPPEQQGQVVQMAYGRNASERTLATYGATYRCITDHSCRIGDPNRLMYQKLIHHK